MKSKNTVEKLKQYFELIDEDKRAFAHDTIEEYVFFLSRIEELKQLPFIQVSEKNPQMQRITPAGKLMKDYSQVVDAKRNTLLKILSSVENAPADELFAMLKEFE